MGTPACSSPSRSSSSSRAGARTTAAAAVTVNSRLNVRHTSPRSPDWSPPSSPPEERPRDSTTMSSPSPTMSSGRIPSTSTRLEWRSAPARHRPSPSRSIRGRMPAHQRSRSSRSCSKNGWSGRPDTATNSSRSSHSSLGSATTTFVIGSKTERISAPWRAAAHHSVFSPPSRRRDLPAFIRTSSP